MAHTTAESAAAAGEQLEVSSKDLLSLPRSSKYLSPAMKLLLVSMAALALASYAEEMTCEADGTCDADTTDVVDPCVNKREECAKWAGEGECKNNPGFMMTHCPRACGACPAMDPEELEKEEEEADVDCEDLHELCPKWAQESECVLNPKYMNQACRDSCMLCVNVRESKERGDSEDLIRRKKVFMNISTGKMQKLSGSEEDQALARTVLRSMDIYAKEYLTEPDTPQEIRDACRNEFELCAYWASQGKCRDDVTFMLTNCPLACQICARTEIFHRCAGKRHPLDPAAFNEGGIDEFFQESKDSGKWDGYAPEYITQPKGDEADDPWIVRFDKFLAADESSRLIEIGNELGWEDSEIEEEEFSAGNPNNLPPRRTSKTAVCKVGDSCDADPIYSRVLDRISTVTGVPRANFEGVELLKYDKLESFGVHHDYRIHDNWKPSGQRVLTMLLYLSDVEEGGATGFPDLEWLFVKPKSGQALLWPNVQSSDPTKADKRLVHEGLPVTKGSKYAANVYIHMHDWKAAFERDCV